MSEYMYVLLGIYVFVAVMAMLVSSSIFSDCKNRDENEGILHFLFAWSITIWACIFWLLVLIGMLSYVIWGSCEMEVRSFMNEIKAKREFDKKKKEVAV
jgi:uncharacterized membrane protein